MQARCCQAQPVAVLRVRSVTQPHSAQFHLAEASCSHLCLLCDTMCVRVFGCLCTAAGCLTSHLAPICRTPTTGECAPQCGGHTYPRRSQSHSHAVAHSTPHAVQTDFVLCVNHTACRPLTKEPFWGPQRCGVAQKLTPADAGAYPPAHSLHAHPPCPIETARQLG